MIVHVEYRCPECDKVFNCPANLASHRRWHKPKNNNNNNAATITKPSQDNKEEEGEENNNIDKTDDEQNQANYTCEICLKTFKRANSLRKHLVQVHPSTPLTSSPMSSPTSSTSKYSIAELLSPSKSVEQQKNNFSVSGILSPYIPLLSGTFPVTH